MKRQLEDSGSPVKRRRSSPSTGSECGLSDSQASPVRELVERVVMVGQEGMLGAIPREYVDLVGVDTNGAFGSIIKARRRGSSAVFVIKRQSLKECSNCETAYREFRALKHTSLASPHPALVDLHDAWVSHDFLYIVEPCLEFDLTKYISRMSRWKRGVSVASRRYIIKVILEGLDHLHKCNIMHRDFKPENVCITTDDYGEAVDVKLIDFGSCRRPLEKKDRAMYPPMTYGKYVTTHPYRPPETVEENSEYCFKVDSWSAGCVIAELISCNTLFSCPEDSLKTSHEAWSVTSLPHLVPTATPHELAVLRVLLRTDPIDRASPEEALKIFDCGHDRQPAVEFHPPHYSYEEIDVVRKYLDADVAEFLGAGGQSDAGNNSGSSSE